MNIAITIALAWTIAVSARHAHSENEHARNPESVPEYRRVRNQCNWVPYNGRKRVCSAPIQTCTVQTTLPEGEGYIYITRFGPFATNGGVQSVSCQSDAHRPVPGSFMIRGSYSVVEPHTGENLGYPPIHYHHLVPVNKDLPPLLPAIQLEAMPWLSKTEYESQFQTFPSSAADKQCVDEEGGADCFPVKLPSGYAKRIYGNGPPPELSFTIQDVRAMGSPLLSSYVDLAEVYVSVPNPALPPLTPVLDFSMFIGKADNVPHTYSLQYNTSMLQFVTYYFPTRAELLSIRTHSHPITGDEIWMVRGTQSDIGIPLEIQRPPDTYAPSGAFGPTGDAVPIPPDELEEWKSRFQLHIAKAAADYEHRKQRMDHHSSNIVKNSDRMLYYTTNMTESMEKPEILCKYYAVVDSLEQKQLELQKEKIRRKFNEEGLVVSYSSTSNSSIHKNNDYSYKRYRSEYIAPENNKQIPTTIMVSAEDQLRALTTGLLPGNYYRRPVTSRDRGESEFRKCNAFTVNAGEFITMLHFLQPRLQQMPSNEHMPRFDDAQFVMKQHSAFFGAVALPDVPFL